MVVNVIIGGMSSRLTFLDCRGLRVLQAVAQGGELLQRAGAQFRRNKSMVYLVVPPLQV